MSALASIEWTEPTTLTEGGEPQVYLAAVSVREIFADPTYQRDLDRPRAEHMAREDHWNVRLLGVIELSDRGEGMQPDRYAVINGQHRVEAARLRDRDMPLVAKVHTGLSIEQEAQLFHEIDASTRRLTTWDRWKARRAGGDAVVAAIEAVVVAAGMQVDMAPNNGNIRCTSTLEKVYKLGGGGKGLLLENTLTFIAEVWGKRLDAVDAPLVLGVALILHSYDDVLDHERLGDLLVDYAPRQIKARAEALRETENGQAGKLAALVMISAYNSARGTKKLARDQLGRPSKPQARTSKEAV
ncbi:hypothetical protein OHB26_39360 (plasmid) [Nocardia sp. NBC_01503]|uniref:DUF6551 family protein n=1 Tax=Nocardia sp. NBC_01503 TaxID=2975997 RepID=UPI002E7B7B6A|nr:DUF6551 family protein [Nocardia sp. NBC_01503]WTL36709.1 hypothetical protein OHB26_39215 [Nocardia sp. NBC_01503]WTL36738.1 hypothetical protein OHB26_39360 [Nocardia sp. NBC_01503]